jgi:hypothetical protein
MRSISILEANLSRKMKNNEQGKITKIKEKVKFFLTVTHHAK